MNNEYYERFNLESNKKVLEIYRNRDQYVQEAQDEIIEILKKRNLYEQAIEQDKNDEVEDKKLEEESIQSFESKVFGSYLSNIEFAQNSLQGNEYFSANFSANENNSSALALVAGTLGTVSLFLFLMMNDYKINLVLYWALPSLLLSLFLIIGIKGHRSSKSTVKLLRKGDKQIDLEVQIKESKVTINYPFRYEYYWTYLQNVKPRIRQVDLFIYIYKDNKMLISLNETLDASKNPPPHWNYFLDERVKKEPRFSFSKYGFQSPNLYKLQKILDGIKEQY